MQRDLIERIADAPCEREMKGYRAHPNVWRQRLIAKRAEALRQEQRRQEAGRVQA